jgi:hypothetical protein
MSSEEERIAELEAELARLKAERESEQKAAPATAPTAAVVDEFGVPLNIPIPIVVGSDVKWRPAKTPLYIRDPERACWGRTSRRRFPRIGA